MEKKEMSLEEKYNFTEKKSEELIRDNPNIHTLFNIPKSEQTEEMLIEVCKNDGWALRIASKRLITPRLCEIAVNQNGAALEFVPQKVFDNVKKYGRDVDWAKRLYRSAVKTYGNALKFIPEEDIDEDMVRQAIMAEKEDGRHYRHPIEYVPDKFKTHDICILSVSISPFSIRNMNENITDYEELVHIAVGKNGGVLEFINEKYYTEQLVKEAVLSNPMAIQFIPEKYITREMSNYCFEEDYWSFIFIPSQYITEDMCIWIIKNDHFSVFQVEGILASGDYPITFSQFPYKMKNKKSVINAIIDAEKDNVEKLLEWDNRIKKKISENDTNHTLTDRRGELLRPLNDSIRKYISERIQKSEVEKDKNDKLIVLDNDTSIEDSRKLPESYALIPEAPKSIILHDLSETVHSASRIYYVTDIHIGYQIRDEYNAAVINKRLNNYEASLLKYQMIEQKVSEMLEGLDKEKGTILVGGDTSNDIELAEIFYNILYKKWKGNIVVILGNHELWDNRSQRSIDEITKDYRNKIKSIDREYSDSHIYFLENELLVQYKNDQIKIISEADILHQPEEEMNKILSKCSLMILGGIGYSGLNIYYNAEHIMYNENMDLAEDKRRAARFRTLHDKIARCIPDKKVIVLSHTPVFDWMSETECVADWVYINGHTHQNTVKRLENGAVILADNQIGYKPQKWKLNSFLIDCWYDPFESYVDGIYKITSIQYKEFHLGRGIFSKGCSYPGTLFMLKKSGLYMFLLKSVTSLCLMVGGQRKKLGIDDVNYYYENMDLYGEKIREIIKPYQTAMENLSKEVRRFGGTGYIHGCIVDISYFSHIYVNPYDGKVTPYWALDISGRQVYKDVKTLLLSKEPELAKRYELSSEKESFPLLEAAANKKYSLAKIPKWVMGAEIYSESRIMKSIQYVWQHNIIRIWNDKVFDSKGRKPKKIEKSSDEHSTEMTIQTTIQHTPAQYTVSKEVADLFIGREKVMKDGKKATIIAYYTRWDITVQFEDGRIEEHRTIFEFNKGNIN